MEKGWDRFIKMIQAELDALNGKTTTTTPTPNPTTNTAFKVGNYKNYVVTTDALITPYVAPVSTPSKTVNYRVRITADSLNVRKEPNATAKVATTVKKGKQKYYLFTPIPRSPQNRNKR